MHRFKIIFICLCLVSIPILHSFHHCENEETCMICAQVKRIQKEILWLIPLVVINSSITFPIIRIIKKEVKQVIYHCPIIENIRMNN